MKAFLLFCVVWLMTCRGELRAQAFYRAAPMQLALVEPQVDNLFPNPALSNVTIILNYIPVQKVYVDVVDYNGTVRSSYAFAPGGRQLNFDVGFLDRGNYVVRVREANRLIDRVKLVKA